MDQSETHLLFFAETQQRQSYPRVPQSSLSLSSTCAEKLWVEIATNSRYYGIILRTPLLVPTAQFYCSSKYRYNGHQLAFFSITSLQNLLIMTHNFNRGFFCTQPLHSKYALIIVIYRKTHPPLSLNCYRFAKHISNALSYVPITPSILLFSHRVVKFS